MSGYVPAQLPDLSQHDVLTWLDDLISDVATGANREWENPWLEEYVEAMWGWLDDQAEPVTDSLEQRMIGHILSPPGDVESLSEYFAAVKARVKSPVEGWPGHLDTPKPNWGMIGMALRAARYYE